MNSGHIVMNKYLVGKGMHPQDAEHVVINSGAGIVDWFKKNKGKILGALGVAGTLAASAAIKNYQNNKNAEQVVNAFRRGMSGNGFFDELKNVGKDVLKDVLRNQADKLVKYGLEKGEKLVKTGLKKGEKYVKNYLKKPKSKPKIKSKTDQDTEKMYRKENNIQLSELSQYLRTAILYYRKKRVPEIELYKLIDKSLMGLKSDDDIVNDLENMYGAGIVDWFKKHKNALYNFGKAGWDLYK